MTWGLRGTSLAITLALWEWYGRSTNPILFTYPTAIARAALDMLADGTLLSALGQSLSVLSTGFALGTLVGVGLGLLAGRSQVVAGLLDIPVTALYSTPMVALVPILVLWFGFGTSAKIVVVLLFTGFPVLINTQRGVREVDPRLIEVAHAFCSTEYRLWTDLILASALPFIMTGIRLAIGRALIAVIIAEFYTAISGLGYLIVSNAHAFRTARVFVPIVGLKSPTSHSWSIGGRSCGCSANWAPHRSDRVCSASIFRGSRSCSAAIDAGAGSQGLASQSQRVGPDPPRCGGWNACSYASEVRTRVLNSYRP